MFKRPLSDLKKKKEKNLLSTFKNKGTWTFSAGYDGVNGSGVNNRKIWAKYIKQLCRHGTAVITWLQS